MNNKIAVVIPSFKVKNHILNVISKIGKEVDTIYVVDDKCPENTGKFVEENNTDKRVKVIYNAVNQGVGGAVMAGYKKAIEDQCKIVVKVDGDDQMDPKLIPHFIKPILEGKADYTKGNRFFNLSNLKQMPIIRLMGNTSLSFINKFSSGYWDIMDPTNGYTAIHCSVLKLLQFEKIEKRYFFESDMLFRLNTIRAVIYDIPMVAVYGDEKSNLSVFKVLIDFPGKYLNRFFKRIFYSYFLRDFNIGSLELISGFILFIFGILFGSYHWYIGFIQHIETHTGTIMLSVLPIILGFQLLLSFIHFDISNIPKRTLYLDLD